MRLILLTVFVLFYWSSNAQYLPALAQKKLEKHVKYLASDKLEGRSPGTNGEKLAADYISAQFKKIGLEPAGTNNGWFQEFEFVEDAFASDKTSLKIHNTVFKLNEDFWPLSASANGSVTAECIYLKFGITSPENNYDDYKPYKESELKGKIFALEVSTPDGVHPHSAYIKHADLDSKVKLAQKHGAAGVIFLENYKTADEPAQRLSKSVSENQIPVVFAKGFANKLLLDGGNLKAQIHVEIIRNKGKGKNVIGMVNNGKATNVIIGAHYDHLGYGDAGSLYKGEKAIHNGADDNASGTSALIEIAAYLKQFGPKNNNYIFVAFSAEEKGLLGSNDFVKSALFDPNTANYMINMDMVGRLRDNEVAVSGTGTSTHWEPILKSVNSGGLKYKSDESGIGPSDHTSFYLKNIPVLHVFTGAHADYHKPTDDWDKINYPGMKQVCDFILGIVHKADSVGRFDFVKTKEKESGKSPKFSVTMGIVPDYMYSGEGVRLDGVSDGKPASKAGLKAGDVLMQIGDFKVKDMTSYMETLSKFKKGDEVIAKVKRGETIQEFKIVF